MAKISLLPEVAKATGLETVVVFDGGVTRRVLLRDLAAPAIKEAEAARDTARDIVARRDILPCDAVARSAGGSVNPNWIVVTPKAGYTIAAGSEYRFAFTMPATNTSSVIVDVVGLTNGDVRQLRLGDLATQVPRGLLQQGMYIEIRYASTGQFALITPIATRTSYVPLLQVNGSPSFLQCVMPAGTLLLPNPMFLVGAPADRLVGEFSGMILEIEGVNAGDPRQIVYPDGSQIGAKAWRQGQRLSVYLSAVTGKFILTDPAPPAASTATTPSYAAFYGSMNNQAATLAAFGK